MRPFMDYVQHAFYEASGWDIDNSYATLNYTARGLLYFDTPHGLRVNVSSLSSPHSANSYDFGSVGLLNGSLSYLYSSLALNTNSQSGTLDLRSVVPGYRQVRELRKPTEAWSDEVWQNGIRIDRKDTLLYGRLFLPKSTLEALYLRRLSPTRQIRISCVSDSQLPNGGTILALLQQDVGKHSTEFLYSTDSALLGFRGLYNFRYDPRQVMTGAAAGIGTGQDKEDEKADSSQFNGRFSAGGELYYGILNKSGGLSTGLRFTTLPSHTGFPYTMTLTMNPLMGNLSSTYAVKAGSNMAYCSQFDFNFYSYESDVRLGAELWRMKQSDVAWAATMMRQGWKTVTGQSLGPGDEEEAAGVLKVRWERSSQTVGLLWEGRFKDLLFSAGVNLDLRRRDQIFRAAGAEFQFSS